MKQSVYSSRSIRALLMAGVAVGTVAISAAPAMADDLEEIVVTGSRIARSNLDTTSPLAVVSSEELTLTGTATVENILNQLPQIVPGLNASSNNGSDGTASVDLRGLGRNRTLVLVNSHRAPPSDLAGSVDINAIPAALIERIEVTTGGASATYGSDAIAGVVNFILKKDFEGAQVDAGYKITDRNDGQEYSVSSTFGSNFDNGRGNVTFHAGYTNRDAVLQGARSFSRFALGDTGVLGETVVLGSPTTSAGTFADGATNPTPLDRADGSVGSAASGSNGLTFNNSGALIAANNPGTWYNFAPENYLQTPFTRHVLYGRASYEVLPDINFFTSGTFTRNQVALQLAPSPGTGFTVQATNPLIPTALAQQLALRANPTASFTARRRFNEVGPRQESYKNDQYSVITGFEGTVAETKFDLTYNYGRFDFLDIQRGNVSRQRVNNALNAVRDSTGAIVCADAAARAAGCVPLNIFGVGTISQAAADYVRVPTASNTLNFTQQVVQGNVSRSLFELPAGEVALALGAEYRKQSGAVRFDQVLSSGDVIGFNGNQPVSGSFDVSEFYGETTIPLLADLPFIKKLEAEGGYRYSDYSTVGGVSAYKYGGSWQVIDQLRFRGLVSRSVRAPSLQELFQPQIEGFPSGINDPCDIGVRSSAANASRRAAIEAECTRQGFDAASLAGYRTPPQLRTITGGNPDLHEETSDSFTVGAVISPIEDLNFSVDYYKIKLDGYIATFGGGAQNVLNNCFGLSGSAPPGANNPYCQVIRRAPGTGSLSDQPFGIASTLQNVSSLKTDGIDVTLNYRKDLEDLDKSLTGTVRFAFEGSWLNRYQLKADSTSNTVDFAGSIGDIGAGFPHYRADLRTTYALDNWSLSWKVQFVSKGTDVQVNQARATGAADPYADLSAPRISAYWLNDFTGQISLYEKVDLTLGILNAFDKKPPLILGTIGANTNTSQYDSLGRRFFGSVSVKF